MADGKKRRGPRTASSKLEEQGLSALPALLKAMLEILPSAGTMSECARLMGKKYHQLSSLHRRRYTLGGDDAYSRAFDEAVEQSTQELEAEAMRRAVKGMRRLKFHKGELIKVPLLNDKGQEVIGDDGKPVMVPYQEDERSDLLLIFLLKSRRPDVYRDHFKGEIEHSGNVGVQVSGVLAIERPAATSKEWEEEGG